MGKEIAYCGLNCETCIVKTTIRSEGEKGLDKLAEKWSTPENKFSGKDLFCDSYCRDEEGTIPSFCQYCEIRNCAMGRKVENCGTCGSYPCEIINRLFPGDSDQRKILDKIHQGIQLN